MSVLYKIPRGTRAALDAKAGASTIVVGQPYLITDENRLAVGLTTTTYATYALESQGKYRTINFVIDGAGSAITTGIKGDLQVDFAGTIESATLLADQSGSIVVDIWRDTYASYPPVAGDKITASAPPTISGALKSVDATLTGWTTAFSAGDTFRFNVNSVTTIQRVLLALKVRVS